MANDLIAKAIQKKTPKRNLIITTIMTKEKSMAMVTEKKIKNNLYTYTKL